MEEGGPLTGAFYFFMNLRSLEQLEQPKARNGNLNFSLFPVIQTGC